MDNDTLADYWRDVSPILKNQAQENRENCFDDRLEYAKKQFEKNFIPFLIVFARHQLKSIKIKKSIKINKLISLNSLVILS